MPREPFTWIELDDEVCSRTFGVGGCPAALGPDVPRKCYGTFATCPVPVAFDPVVRTLRYCEARANLPKGGPVMFPVLTDVSEVSATVNIAGSDNDLSAFGRRATVSATLSEFAHHDRGVDPYATERVTGAAQIDEPGYRPEARGAHFAKQRARSPYYTGRAYRVGQGYLEGGAITDAVLRHYVQTERVIADDGRSVRIDGRDVLDVAGNDRAVAPAPGRGALAAGLDALEGAAVLTPAGIGDLAYPTAGRACVGSEIMGYTRAGDVLTLTGRGLAGTAATSHAAGDTVQPVLWVDGWTVDYTLKVLFHDFAKVPLAVLPLDDWAAERARWMPQVRLHTHICKPEGVAGLVGELAMLGLTVWPDELAQKVRMMVNRPPDPGTVRTITDASNVLAVRVEDRQKDRLTDVMFFSVQIDPTKSATSAENYRRVAMTAATKQKGPNAFNDARVRKVFCRWLNEGADSVVLTLSNRFLNRYAEPPRLVELDLPDKDRGVKLVDVIDLSTRAVQDVTGRPLAGQWQVRRRAEPERGRKLRITAQAFQFTQRYGFATENGRPDYAASTPAQRARGLYACDPVTLKMTNGDEPYRAI